MSMTENLSQLKDFLAYLARTPGDLSNITAPPFVLSQKSAVEFPAAWAQHHDIFLAQADEALSSEERALAVLKNFLCSLRAQSYTGRTEAEGVKKPLNAFLGELFFASVGEEGSETRLVAEQVSHHPPVTACALYNTEAGVSAEGYLAQETTFSATKGVTVNQIGFAIVHIAHCDESHLITLPTLGVKGVFSGTPYPELRDSCFIVSSAGYTSRIDFEGKSVLKSTEKNSLHATLYATEKGMEQGALFEVEGTWNKTLTLRDVRDGKREVLETIEIDALKEYEVRVAPVDQQDVWESRRAWKDVTDGIEAKDMARVSEAKNKIEEAQRGIRKVEKENGVEWPRIFFKREHDYKVAEQLLNHVPKQGEEKVGQGDLQTQRTNGIWRFIGPQAVEAIERPFHKGLAPYGQVED